MWARHDERAAEHELEKESADVELPGIAEQPASARAGGVLPSPAGQAGEAEAERPSVELD
jgi:hypothetical protein